MALGDRPAPQGLGVPHTLHAEPSCRGRRVQTRALLLVGVAGMFYLGRKVTTFPVKMSVIMESDPCFIGKIV